MDLGKAEAKTVQRLFSFTGVCSEAPFSPNLLSPPQLKLKSQTKCRSRAPKFG